MISVDPYFATSKTTLDVRAMRVTLSERASSGGFDCAGATGRLKLKRPVNTNDRAEKRPKMPAGRNDRCARKIDVFHESHSELLSPSASVHSDHERATNTFQGQSGGIIHSATSRLAWPWPTISP